MNCRFSLVIALIIALGFYFSFSITFTQISIASANQSIEVIGHTDSDTFRKLSRNFDETLDNINNKTNNDNTTQSSSNNDDELL